ncbi:MAG: serine--tRNA ligase [Alphaproteobacteria bacterium]
MIDLKLLREDPDAFDRGWALRGLPAQAAGLLEQDVALRALKTRLQEAQNERNAASKQIGKAKASGDEAAAQAVIERVSALKAEIQQGEEEERQLAEALDLALASLPNIPAADVPDGADENDNVEIGRTGDPRNFAFDPKEHFDLGEDLGQMDFETAAAMSGSRFVALKGQLARLERAIAQFMLNLHADEFGYEEVAPPFLVRDEAVFGTAQLPKFTEDLFRTENGYWLIPTAEVSLTNMVRQAILSEAELPLRMTAYTPCFRSEAGSAGRDTRGMIRLHQFSKVELVSITTPDQGEAELDRMTECAQTVLKRLELPFRTMKLCSGDMGFSARRTYDLEVWLPGQNAYREISSCSWCGDFQARRMKARFKPNEGKGNQFVHTLNGSGLAVGRTLVAILENYQQENGTIAVPDVLKPYMGGVEEIVARG